MKKYLASGALMLTCAAILCSCGQKSSSENKTSPPKSTTAAATQKPTDTPKPSPESTAATSTSPKDFKQMTSSEMAALPDKDAMIEKASTAAASIGVTGITECNYGNYSSDDTETRLDVYIVTDTGKKLLVNMMNITLTNSGWNVLAIADVDTGYCYYATESAKDAIDIYDYNTGELTSPKTKSWDELQ